MAAVQAAHNVPAGAGCKGGKLAKKKAKLKQLPSDDDRVPLLGSSGATMLHHAGKSSAQYDTPNHAVQP